MSPRGPIQLCSIAFGSETISFELRRAERRRLRITVHPNLRVVVLAPKDASTRTVEAEVRRRGTWILRHFGRFKEMPHQAEKHYVSGESLRYLGRQYRLKVIEASRGSAKLVGKYLWVCVREKANTDAVERVVRRWYREHARRVFERRLDVCHEIAARHGITRPRIDIRWMKTRWGSTPGTDHILLNTQLVKAPTYCIDYVIAHELCHLKRPHHGKEFYRLLSRCMPAWKARKKRLEEVEL